ncbi:cell cycle checkpoint protein, partial [Phenoliferia sp. Uapishka_3]
MPQAHPPDILVATVLDVRPLASMLRALSFRPKVVVDILEYGLKFTVEEGRSIQGYCPYSRYPQRWPPNPPPSTANAYLQATTFTTWTCTPPPPDSQEQEEENLPHCSFGISLSTMLECLNIFGNASGGSGPAKFGEGEGGFKKRGGEDAE